MKMRWGGGMKGDVWEWGDGREKELGVGQFAIRMRENIGYDTY